MFCRDRYYRGIRVGTEDKCFVGIGNIMVFR